MRAISPLLYIIVCYLMLDFYVKTRIKFSLRYSRLFDITEVEIMRVDCICQSTVDIEPMGTKRLL